MSDKFKYTAGLNNVGSYQVSGKPFVTASTISDGVEQQIEFPQVTNNITVKIDSDASIANNSLFISASINSALYYETENAVSNGSNDAGSFFPTNGWKHVVFSVGNSAQAAYVNGIAIETDNETGTLASSFGDRIRVGPMLASEGDKAIRDAILWDDALTAPEALALYEAGQNYDDPAFQVANKLFWLKPSEGLGSYQKLKQHGSLATGDLVLSGLGAPEIAKVISDSPFPDVKTTSQTVRFFVRRNYRRSSCSRCLAEQICSN